MVKTALLLFFGLVLTINAFSQTRMAPPNDPNVMARSGQAEIIINASNSDRDIAVWINGAIVAHVPPHTSEKIIVHNGQNQVEVADTQWNRNQWRTGTRRQIAVVSNSNCVTVGMSLRYGAVVSLSIQSTTALGGGPPLPSVAAGSSSAPPGRATSSGSAPPPVRPASPPPVAVESEAIENAVYRAAWMIIENLPDGSTVAVLSISSDDSEIAEFIIEELVFLIVETRRFRVVDRRSLDAVRAETHFQYSGDVDDDSAVSIGRMLGASVVITGSASGTGATRRLRAKALDVQTAEILAMASERY